MIMISALHAAPVWDRNRQGDTEAQLETAEPGTVITQYDAGHEPVTAPVARVGFQGLRAVTERIVHKVMPGLPMGPPILIASRSTPAAVGRAAVTRITAAVVPLPVVSTEQQAPWYEHLQ